MSDATSALTATDRARANAAVAGSETYYNGGVEDRALQAWFETTFADLWAQAAIGAPPAPEAGRAASGEAATRHLCVDCTLCCNGTLFSRVTVTPDERARLGGGPEFSQVEGRIKMRQPCTRLGSDGCCSVYEHRPRSCRTYRCNLLERHEGGEIDRATADLLVAEAKQMQQATVDWFTRAMPDHFAGTAFVSAVDARNHAADVYAAGGTVNPHIDAQAWLHYETFVRHIRTHFRSDFDPG